MKEKYTNQLIHASSPYLQQHAHNPVNWVEWSEEAFQQAKEEGKLVLISIGYAACHWCHVMERESFEDEHVAALMNKHLVCIKVDREERPDIDHTYMTAVQLMTKHGGWPLNCFALPNKRPIYGATYFPKKDWINVIEQLAAKYENDREEVQEYGQLLEQEMANTEYLPIQLPKLSFDDTILKQTIESWIKHFDFEEGGNNTAPKFLLPNNYEFLLQYGVQLNDSVVTEHAHFSLTKMALGGIYDQLGGGFSRYSTDRYWKVPHFEKMLYDNGQILSAFSKAYQHKKKILYKDIIEGTIAWAFREMRAPDHGFYSGLDADSEGIEGKYYTWSEEELALILGDDFGWFSDYYNINENGYWENNQFILLRKKDKNEWCAEKGVSIQGLELELERAHKKLFDARKERLAPNLDDKQLTAWNAMMVKGLVDAGLSLQHSHYIEEAINTAQWIVSNQLDAPTGKLFRVRKDGKSTIDGFLEDYAHCINAFIALHEATFEKKWLNFAKLLTDYAYNHFFDSHSKMFFFADKESDQLVRKIEVNDSVIPASNSVMAMNLLKMSKFFEGTDYLRITKQMLSNVYGQMPHYGSAYSNWGILTLALSQPFSEVVITGTDATSTRMKFGNEYIPNVVFGGGKEATSALTNDKEFSTESTIYVCENFACLAPTQSIKEAINTIKKGR